MSDVVNEQKVRDMVRGLGDVEPNSAFRERVKRSFVSGVVGHGSDEREQRRYHLFMPLALAASLALLVGLANHYSGPRWALNRVGGTGQLVVDGHTVAPPIGGARAPLRPNALIHTTGGAEADLVCGELAALRIPSGAELTVPTAPGRWLGRLSNCTLRNGEVRLTTSPKFAGTRLLIHTDIATIEVTGTTLAAFAGSDSTCLCVLEGSARMMDREGASTRVDAGHRLTLFRDSRMPARAEEILPMERMKLEMMRDDAGATLGH